MAVKRPTLGVSSLTAPVINLTGASFYLHNLTIPSTSHLVFRLPVHPVKITTNPIMIIVVVVNSINFGAMQAFISRSFLCAHYTCHRSLLRDQQVVSYQVLALARSDGAAHDPEPRIQCSCHYQG